MFLLCENVFFFCKNKHLEVELPKNYLNFPLPPVVILSCVKAIDYLRRRSPFTLLKWKHNVENLGSISVNYLNSKKHFRTN